MWKDIKRCQLIALVTRGFLPSKGEVGSHKHEPEGYSPRRELIVLFIYFRWHLGPEGRFPRRRHRNTWEWWPCFCLVCLCASMVPSLSFPAWTSFTLVYFLPSSTILQDGGHGASSYDGQGSSSSGGRGRGYDRRFQMRSVEDCFSIRIKQKFMFVRDLA